ncbi:MAG: hypothetical protein ACD_75C01772G0001, partial [uncultured bacterium]
MDPLVLDAHHDRPEGIVPGNRQRQRQAPDDPFNQFPHLAPVGPHLVHRRPVIMLFVQVVPGHLVDPDGKHRLKGGIDPAVDEPGDIQLVDVEGRCMPEIKDQRLTQGFRPQVKSRIARQNI